MEFFLCSPKVVVIYKNKTFLQNNYFYVTFSLSLICKNSVFAKISLYLHDFMKVDSYFNWSLSEYEAIHKIQHKDMCNIVFRVFPFVKFNKTGFSIMLRSMCHRQGKKGQYLGPWAINRKK